ncbi:MAG TPA: GEVED domain-containing protein, partial [Pirellulaceae bacterium]
DFGDAPASYKTLLIDDGPRHQARGGLFLNGAPTLEADGLPNGDAEGDVDDGVVIPGRLQPGTTVAISVTASQPGFLNAWIDLNADGDFDISDKIVTAVAINRGTNQVSALIPATAVGGSSYARFRFSSVADLGPTGAAPDGEVEDYLVSIGASDWQNPDDRYDVNDDGVTAPLDALRVITELDNHRVTDPLTGMLPATRPDGEQYYDVNGDGFVSPLDALLVINQLPSTSNRPNPPGGLVVWSDEEVADSVSRESAVDAIFAQASTSPMGTASRVSDEPATRRRGRAAKLATGDGPSGTARAVNVEELSIRPPLDLA